MNDLPDPELNNLLNRLADELQAVKATGGDLPSAIVELPFNHTKEMALLFLGFLCFYDVERAQQVITLSSHTDNDYYRQAFVSYPFDPKEYKIPFSATDNSLVQAVTSGQPAHVENWDSLRRPQVEEGVARLNQASSGIAFSVICPVGSSDHLLMFNFFQLREELDDVHQQFIDRYTELVASLLTT